MDSLLLHTSTAVTFPKQTSTVAAMLKQRWRACAVHIIHGSAAGFALCCRFGKGVVFPIDRQARQARHSTLPRQQATMQRVLCSL